MIETPLMFMYLDVPFIVNPVLFVKVFCKCKKYIA